MANFSLKGIPVRAQILGGFLSLQGAALAAILLSLHSIQSRLLKAEIDRRIRAGQQTMDSLIKLSLSSTETMFRQAQELIPVDQGEPLLNLISSVLPGLTSPGSGDLFAGGRLKPMALLTVDKAGRVLKSSVPALPTGASIAAWPEFPRALKGEVAHRARFIGDAAYRTAIFPFKSKGGDLFVTLISIEEWWRDFQRYVDAGAAFGLEGRLLASNLKPEDLAILQAALEEIAPGAPALIGPDGRRKLALKFPLGEEGDIYMLQEFDGALEPLRALRRRLLAIGLVTMPLTALLGFFIAKGIAGSTQALIDKLSELNALKSKFFAMVTHDMGSPLTVLLGGVDWLGANPQSPKAPSMLQSIRSSAEAMRFLASDLVDFAAMEAGKLRVERGPMDLRALVLETAGRLAPLAEEKGLRFSVEAGTAPLPVDGDSRRLAQVLQNLVSNAVHYTPRGGAVSVSARAAGGGVEIAVSDTGIGIAPADLARVFESFFQAPNGRALRPGGFGLGLAIARELLRAHDGTLEAESALGKGSVFRMRLPAASPLELAPPLKEARS